MDKAKFKDHLIVPDVVDEAPQEICDVVFKSGAKAVIGNEIQAIDVEEAPKIVYSAEDGAYYAIVLADVDTQNPDKNEGITQWQQWVVMNIPGKDVSKGQVLSEYIGSGPLPGTGLHRYVCLVFKQPGQLQPQEPYFDDTEGDRKGFSIRTFMKKYGLNAPIAGNFYQTKYDESVKELYNEKNQQASAFPSVTV